MCSGSESSGSDVHSVEQAGQAGCAENQSPVAPWKQIVAGTVGGVCQVLVGHPFNTVKARLQAVSAPSTGLAVLSMLLKQEGARGLFKVCTRKLRFIYQSCFPELHTLTYAALFCRLSVTDGTGNGPTTAWDKCNLRRSLPRQRRSPASYCRH